MLNDCHILNTFYWSSDVFNFKFNLLIFSFLKNEYAFKGFLGSYTLLHISFDFFPVFGPLRIVYQPNFVYSNISYSCLILSALAYLQRALLPALSTNFHCSPIIALISLMCIPSFFTNSSSIFYCLNILKGVYALSGGNDYT